MACLTSSHQINEDKVAESLIGSIVVEDESVSFYVFKANSAYVLKSHGPVPLEQSNRLEEGRSEQDPLEILDAVKDCISEVVVPGGKVMGLSVVAVGITNHRCSVLAWNKWTGIPLCDVMMWSDNRAVSIVNEYLWASDKYRFQKVCGLPFSPVFSAFKIKWLVENDLKVRWAYERGNCYFGTVDTWLVWNLTGGIKDGVFATDTTNASNTFLMNINTLQWDPNLLKFFDIDHGSLAEIRTSSQMYGLISDGPLNNVPITGVIGNRQAALVGHRCFRRGMTKATLDASGTVFTVTGENKVFSENGLLTTIAYHLDTRPVFALEGPIASAGKAIEWTERCFNIKTTKHCFKTRGKTKNALYLVPAFNGLYAPHWRTDARCIFMGDNVNTEDIFRATMESVCFQTRDIVNSAVLDLKTPIDKIKIDGKLADNGFIMQSLADITNAHVEVAKCKEMTALGAAMAAGYAPEVNVWNAICMSEDNGAANYQPTLEPNELKKKLFDWKRVVNRSYNWVDTSRSYNTLWLTLGPIAGGLLLLGGYLLLKY